MTLSPIKIPSAEAQDYLEMVTLQIVQDALEKAQEDITSITIAHRLSTIKDVDVIIVINQGEIVETGTHDDLIENTDGHYYKLWNTQVSL